MKMNDNYIIATQKELDEINSLTEEIKQKKLKVREMNEKIVENINEILFHTFKPDHKKPDIDGIKTTRRFSDVGTFCFTREKLFERHKKLYDLFVSWNGEDEKLYTTHDDVDEPNPVYRENKYIPLYVYVDVNYAERTNEITIEISVKLGDLRDWFAFTLVSENTFSMFDGRDWEHVDGKYTMSDVIDFIRWYIDNSVEV